MKINAKMICTLCLAPAVALGVAGCNSGSAENSGYVLQDTDTYPAVTAPYEEESKAALEEYFTTANRYADSDGYIDSSIAAVQAAAKTAAVKLYAYACYNEEYLDRYVYFSDQEGETNLGGGATSSATKQDYKLIIHEDTDVCGYKYHYTIKYVDECSASFSLVKSSFESSKLRFVEQGTGSLYRFNGSNVTYDDDGYLTCSWKVDSSQDGGWGSVDQTPILKRSGDKLTLDEIAEDIAANAQDDDTESVIHGNINIFAEDILSEARIVELEYEDGTTRYVVQMTIDTSVANSDETSLAMIRSSNDSDDCVWGSGDDDFTISCVLWDNGLFYLYQINETWSGSISIFSGSVTSKTQVTYSYSDRDTDITSKLEMLESAKEEYNG